MYIQIPFDRHMARLGRKQEALYQALRESIVKGTLPFTSRLPSSRDLAHQYGLSRGIVTQVYEMLAVEGFVESKVGHGTFVSFRSTRSPVAPETLRGPLLSEWAMRLDSVVQPHWGGSHQVTVSQGRFDFRVQQPDTKLLPNAEWRQHMRESNASERINQGQYGPSIGTTELREGIAHTLRRTRGISVTADDIVVVNGSMQAIALLCQILINPGDTVVMEDPGYRGTYEAALAFGARLLTEPLDHHGLVIRPWSARLAFVTPSRQFPTGVVLSMERRQALLRWAQEADGVIVEDDYDSEFRYGGKPLEPLKALDQEGRVVYIGTFSKSIEQDVRLGYVVLPPWLKSTFMKAQFLYEPRSANLAHQHALASFLRSGGYERHLRRMRRVYARRYAACIEEIQSRLNRWFNPVAVEAGLHVFAWWKGDEETYARFQEGCEHEGIVLPAGSSYMRAQQRPAALFGFSHMEEEDIRVGIRQMAQILQKIDKYTTD